ncbi:acyl-CoA thioesterase [Actinomycetes bacterium NPDC127524]|jgi:acyl-CoA hydrolase|uniref:acyl-CoA thioesterase n=1 Tax=Bacillaceae TaxID=186817 RepID=UPI0008ECB15A|nr:MULTISPECIES: acyl-CoA thioesterase [unclassified Bacillus (in: firmicutes)]OIK13596.1 acyl-CoA thioesterase [Bacillus sp. MUM 13]SFC01494.1 Acyl-CoA hydrolase [Bacillus sp. OV322]
MEEIKYCRDSLVIKTSMVLPPDTNNIGTMFGGKLMAYIDDVAAISAMRHARNSVVTASTDSVDFMHPILEGNAVCLESFVTYTGRSSMEIVVKVVAEDLLSGERNLCAMSFLTFVAIDKDGKPQPVPKVVPQTEMEKSLYQTAKSRAELRKNRRKDTQDIASTFGVDLPW